MTIIILNLLQHSKHMPSIYLLLIYLNVASFRLIHYSLFHLLQHYTASVTHIIEF